MAKPFAILLSIHVIVCAIAMKLASHIKCVTLGESSLVVMSSMFPQIIINVLLPQPNVMSIKCVLP